MIIEKLGGRRKVAELLTAKGHKITLDGVRMWSMRGQIAGAALQLLMIEAERRRIKIKASDITLIDAPRRKPVKSKRC